MNVPTNHTSSGRSPFTMVEVIAMLTVIAVLSAVVVVSFTRGNHALSLETDLLRANLRYAQTQAMADSGATWSVSVEETQYTLLRDGAPAPQSWPNSTSPVHVLDPSVRVSAGTGTLPYDAWGNPGTDDWSIVLQQDDQTSTVTVIGTTGFVR
jgi:type II secretory pathway pseudopilin PulG